MNPQLPAYLQNKARVDLNTRATAGMGGVMPPHISRAGNSFTLIDAAGMKQPIGPTMDACVVDICDVMQKLYYEEDWKQGSDQPPDCYSRNGVAPSRDSAKPQSATCGQCDWNVRGSDTSKISGKPIKACRDQKEIALLLPQYPNMLFQLVVPPGSFKNWAAFCEPFKKGGVDISVVLTRFGFQPQKNGEMTFAAVSYIDEGTADARERTIQSKATDALVGRNDVPIALPAPARTAEVASMTMMPASSTGQQIAEAFADVRSQAQQAAANPGFGGAPQAQVPFGANQTGAAPTPSAGAFGQSAQAPVQPAPASPSERAPRKRRTQAEIAADNAAKAAQTGSAPTPQQPAGQPAQAPFPVNQMGGFGGPLPASGAAAPTGNPSFGPQGQPSGAPIQQETQTGFGQGSVPTASPSNTGSFGIQNGADPNADPALAEMLRGLGQ